VISKGSFADLDTVSRDQRCQYVISFFIIQFEGFLRTYQ